MTSLDTLERFTMSAEIEHSTLTPDPGAFLIKHSEAALYRLTRVPLDALPGWQSAAAISHRLGRFFAVEGLSIETTFGPQSRWTQPIIVQPEVGILGILTQCINGVQHFLMQAKMEPGNTNLVQFAATVQATPSNYQQVHGGRPTPYLEYFREHYRGRIIFDQLLSEHGSWYFHKRNRNMIIEVAANENVSVAEGFAWLTLGQLRRQLQHGNRVNMNARTVLSGISYAAPPGVVSTDMLHQQVVESYATGGGETEVAAAITWLIDQKSNYLLDVRRIPLHSMTEWVQDADSIRHRDGRPFSIIGMSVEASSREISTWSQPMLEPTQLNIVALLCQRRSGVLHVLVQAMVQPGLIDRLELAATVHLSSDQSCSVNESRASERPPLAEYVNAPREWVRVNNSQSEDGGRFLGADTTHLVIEVPEDHLVETPGNYRWMTLAVLNRLIHTGYYLNIEARSLIACLL